MLVWLALGGMALLAVMVLMQGFAQASVATLRLVLPVVGLALGIGLVALLLATGRAGQALGLLAFGAPVLWSLWQRWRAVRRFSQPAAGANGGGAEAGGTTQVSTATLTMTLDHASGQMTGRVRRGRYAGAELAELPLADLLALLADCRAEDPESVPLLEAWLDRVEPDWRAAASAAGAGAEAGPQGGAPPSRDRGGRMDRAEALAVLGLSEGATEEEIRAAHRRLMRSAHPDSGGSAWIAARLNEARDTLLRA